MPETSDRATKSPRIPGSDHPIEIAPNPNRIKISLAGRVVADTRRALTLREAGYAPVEYIPRADVDMALLKRSEHATYCPYKGDCTYFDIPLAAAPGKNAVWTYENPYDAVRSIKDYLAFYPDRVEVTEERSER